MIFGTSVALAYDVFKLKKAIYSKNLSQINILLLNSPPVNIKNFNSEVYKQIILKKKPVDQSTPIRMPYVSTLDRHIREKKDVQKINPSSQNHFSILNKSTMPPAT